MNIAVNLTLAFLMGGFISGVIQVLIDKTSFTPARILTGLVASGVLLYAIGLYEPLYKIFGRGISTPLLGFGAAIARGVKEAVESTGLIGVLTGGLTSTAAGITTALLLGTFFSLFYFGRARRMG